MAFNRVLVLVGVSVVLMGSIVTSFPARGPAGETLLYTYTRNSAIGPGATLGGRVLVARGFYVQAVNLSIGGASGGGAGASSFRLSDGTNNCDFTVACTTSSSNGSYRTAISAGVAALTGTCVFAAGATVRGSVTASNCTTTQPTVSNFDVLGDWM